MKSIKIVAICNVCLFVVALVLGRFSNYLEHHHPLSSPLFICSLAVFHFAPIVSIMNLLNLYMYKTDFKNKILWYFISCIPILLSLTILVLIIYYFI